jgi:cellobiose phosphorylase
MVRVEGGWRIYSSGPGIYARLIIGHVFGHHRQWGRGTARPLLPRALQDVSVELDSGG